MSILARGPMRALMTVVSVVLAGSALVSAPTAAAGSVSFSTVLSGYSRPVLVTAPKGSSRRIFIVEQTGRIQVATFNGSSYVKEGTFLDLRDRVRYNGGEQGLLGLAFDPDYATNGRFYVDYTRKPDGDTVVAEFRRSSSTRARKSSARTVLRINQPYSNHNGGMLAFGPDGYLYIGTGDGGSAGDPGNRAQNTSKLLGKILRIRPYKSGSRGYTVPSSNPFVGRSGSDLVWAYGLRNPWRFSFDRSTGDLWIGDVGQSRYEEIDLATNSGGRGRGVNYGWHRCEGRKTYPHDRTCTFGRKPIKVYRHGSNGCSVSGGYAYRGPDFASGWQGKYIYGDYCSGRVWVIDKSGSVRASRDTSYNISGFGEDGRGRLFMTDLGGRILRVRFSGSP
jgi:glucose/arabinose dehydrogenase